MDLPGSAISIPNKIYVDKIIIYENRVIEI